MDTTSKFSSESEGETSEEIIIEGSDAIVEDKGFFGMLVQSIFEVSHTSWSLLIFSQEPTTPSYLL
jgi:hypothetical protein